jgi:hypothetical protein
MKVFVFIKEFNRVFWLAQYVRLLQLFKRIPAKVDK